MKILDCTLRDGGYYTQWDFKRYIVDSYIETMNVLPIDYVEIGYRSLSSEKYMGMFAYCPVYELKRIREFCQKKMAIMINEKEVTCEDVNVLLNPIIGLIDMVRIAVDPQNVERAVVLATTIKELNFEVGLNIMYMSKWDTYDDFYKKLFNIHEVVDVIYMVDSFGSISPDEIAPILRRVKEVSKCDIGFHGHNNLQLGLINTYTAIENGVEFVDSTILGMGRGAGNLNLELLLTYLNRKKELSVDFNKLGDVISIFEPLHRQYNWGTNLPYMLSGANSFPQKEVMGWVSNRRYSFNSIVRALNNRCDNLEDNAKYALMPNILFNEVIIIGGGESINEHIDGIKEFLYTREEILIIHASTRNANLFIDIDIPQVYCLAGNEARRMTSLIKEESYKGRCVLPPYPRMMGTEVPQYAKKTTFELSEISFTDEYKDSCTAIALQLAINVKATKVFIAGYDGYRGNVMSEKENDLTRENRKLFDDFNKRNCGIISITNTLYKELQIISMYQNI